MINIFLSHSSKDDDYVRAVIDKMDVLPDKYKLIYFLQPYSSDTPMQNILQHLEETQLFILFISNSSLEKVFVREEINTALELLRLGKMRALLGLIIDRTVSEHDIRIPREFLTTNTFYTDEPEKAVELAKEFIFQF